LFLDRPESFDYNVVENIRMGEQNMYAKELVTRFFVKGYQTRNYDFIMDRVSEGYIDHSPSGARSNRDAVEIERQLRC